MVQAAELLTMAAGTRDETRPLPFLEFRPRHSTDSWKECHGLLDQIPIPDIQFGHNKSSDSF